MDCFYLACGNAGCSLLCFLSSDYPGCCEPSVVMVDNFTFVDDCQSSLLLKLLQVKITSSSTPHFIGPLSACMPIVKAIRWTVLEICKPHTDRQTDRQRHVEWLDSVDVPKSQTYILLFAMWNGISCSLKSSHFGLSTALKVRKKAVKDPH